MNDLIRSRWRRSKNNTLRHYTKKLPWKVRQFNHELYLPDYFGPMIGDKKEVVVAEIGAGMFCTIGSLSKNAGVKVYPSDILADEFNQILKDHQIKPFIPIEKQDMENLTYEDSFFDIVHCVNALDHTPDPIKAIKEMYRICKPNGYLYFRHFVNVGEHEKYRGLHSWNLEITRDNDCLIWNKEYKFLLTGLIPGFKNTIQKDTVPNQIISIFHKQ